MEFEPLMCASDPTWSFTVDFLQLTCLKQASQKSNFSLIIILSDLNKLDIFTTWLGLVLVSRFLFTDLLSSECSLHTSSDDESNGIAQSTSISLCPVWVSKTSSSDSNEICFSFLLKEGRTRVIFLVVATGFSADPLSFNCFCFCGGFCCCFLCLLRWLFSASCALVKRFGKK